MFIIELLGQHLLTWHRKWPKCQPPRISSDNLGIITVKAKMRSAKAREAMNRCPGLCRAALLMMQISMKMFPMTAKDVRKDSKLKTKVLSMLKVSSSSELAELEFE